MFVIVLGRLTFYHYSVVFFILINSLSLSLSLPIEENKYSIQVCGFKLAIPAQGRIQHVVGDIWYTVFSTMKWICFCQRSRTDITRTHFILSGQISFEEGWKDRWGLRAEASSDSRSPGAASFLMPQMSQGPLSRSGRWAFDLVVRGIEWEKRRE